MTVLRRILPTAFVLLTFAPSFLHACSCVIVGDGCGRDQFGDRLDLFLQRLEVQEFKLQQVTAKGICLQSRAHFLYRNRSNGMDIDGSMRHVWRFVGDEIAHFELFHDSPKMRAFYAMSAM